MDRRILRSELAGKRERLTTHQSRSLAAAVNRHLWRMPAFSRNPRIACYFAVRGEVSCEPIIAEAWRRGRNVFLPVLADRALMFARYRHDSPLRENRFGIPEPIYKESELVQPSGLDVVICPLIAFDKDCNRLGMGAGYYDRSFRFLAHARNWKRPRLIGAAYEFQKVPEVKARSWDIPMQNIVTEKQVHTALSATG